MRVACRLQLAQASKDREAENFAPEPFDLRELRYARGRGAYTQAVST
jgi:hypothetical protein